MKTATAAPAPKAKKATNTAAALKAAIASGKFTSRALAKEFGAAFTAAKEAGKIAWKRTAPTKKGARGHYFATPATA